MTSSIAINLTTPSSQALPQSGLLDGLNFLKADPTVLSEHALKKASNDLKSQFSAASGEKDFAKRVQSLTSTIVSANNLEYELARIKKDSLTNRLLLPAAASMGILSLGGGTVASFIGAASASVAAPVALVAGAALIVGSMAIEGREEFFGKTVKFRENAENIREESTKLLKELARSNPTSFKTAFDNAITMMPDVIKLAECSKHNVTESKYVYSNHLYGEILDAPRPRY